MSARLALVAALLPWLVGACGADGPRALPRGVVLLTVDTLRADALGCYGGATPTPHFDRLAAESLVFDRAYTQASHTHPALTSMLTGLAPPHTGVMMQGHRLARGVVPMAPVLQAGGVATGSFVANLCRLQETPRTVFHDGWDERFCGMDESVDQYLWDEQVVAAAADWIERQETPFFAWVHLMDPHGEHRPPPDLWDREARPLPPPGGQYRRLGELEREHALPPADELDELRALYAAEVAGVDRLLGRFLERLEALPTWDMTTLVVSADHGEELFETWPKHGHGFSLTEGVLRVPLLVRAPDVAPARRDQLVELLQVAPTVYELFGIPPPYELDGPSLLRPTPGRGFTVSYAGPLVTARRGDLRLWHQTTTLPYRLDPEESEQIQLYQEVAPWFRQRLLLARYAEDAPTAPEWLFPAPPTEDDEAAQKHEQRANGMRAKLEGYLKEMRDVRTVDAIEDGELRSQLEDLGYY